MNSPICRSLRLVWAVLFILALAGVAQADLLAGWKMVNSSTNVTPLPYTATTNHLKMTAQMAWTNLYK